MACTCIQLKITTPHYLLQWHVHVYSSRLRLHILYNNGMCMYIAQDYDPTFFTTMACTCIQLKITTPHSLLEWHVYVYISRLRPHILYNNGMYMYIAQDYDSTFFTTMTCTCIKLKITTPHSLEQWHVHVYISRLRLHILYNNGILLTGGTHLHGCIISLRDEVLRP